MSVLICWPRYVDGSTGLTEPAAECLGRLCRSKSSRLNVQSSSHRQEDKKKKVGPTMKNKQTQAVPVRCKGQQGQSSRTRSGETNWENEKSSRLKSSQGRTSEVHGPGLVIWGGRPGPLNWLQYGVRTGLLECQSKGEELRKRKQE